MKGSTLLTGLLATTAAGAGITTLTSITTFATGEYNTATDNPPTATIDSGAAPTALRAKKPGLFCYEDRKPEPCYGINRATAIDAIEWFCNYYKDFVFSATTAYPWDAAGTWSYTPSKKHQGEQAGAGNIKDEGKINMTISIITTECEMPVVQVDYDACLSWMKTPLDKCDTDGENGKHGGYIDDECLRYEFQPNPTLWPDCLFEY